VQRDKVLCGYHSDKWLRRILPKNPKKLQLEQEMMSMHNREVSRIREKNRREGRRGQVLCSPMTMWQNQQPKYISGFENIFPNYKHGGKQDGWGLPQLSPKSMGPVEHPQPGLPPAKNLENFHQFSKKFPGETIMEFRKTQIEAFNDSFPHRHKPQAKKRDAKGQRIRPLCWVWTRRDFSMKEMTYIECRQFYCNYYERFAKKSPEFKALKDAVDSGLNVRICGYDGYAVTKSVEEQYLDASKPFGHELVLYTMLTVEKEEEYPWRSHKTEDF
jgi:hypothetical protein